MTLVILLVSFVLPADAQNANLENPIEGVQFDDSRIVGATAIPLRGTGLLTWYFIDAYVAALYLPDHVPSTQFDADQPKALELHYFHDIDGEDFGPAGEEVLKRMLPSSSIEAIRPGLNQIKAAYVDIKEGDRYTLVYEPNLGTTLEHNGKALVTIPGKEFAAAYFHIWLGDKSVDNDLRDELFNCKVQTTC